MIERARECVVMQFMPITITTIIKHIYVYTIYV